MRKKYKKRSNQFIVAVQLELETDGLTYKKWGAEQYAKPGDWIVKNRDDVYTIDQDVFKKTYMSIGDSKYVKTTPIWAEKTTQHGIVKTKEGVSHYKAGDFLIFNVEDESDSYCISADDFNEMYEAI